MLDRLQQLYPNRVISLETVNDIPKDCYMVYILIFNGSPIVLGHGKKNRSKVIFDNQEQITSSHLKALFVRLYRLYGNGIFERYIISCQNKSEAKEIEANLHREIGGNNRHLTPEIRNQLFQGLEVDSITHLLLEIALRSSFDGLADIRKWRSDGLISDLAWNEISQRLRLNSPN
jgi:hypothetical protein